MKFINSTKIRKKSILFISTIIFLINTYLSLESVFSNSFLELEERENESEKESLSKALSNLEEEVVEYQSWVKYFKYNPGKLVVNKNFMINSDFKTKDNKNDHLKDNFGSINIPTNKHFFAVIRKDSVQLFTSRINQYKHNSDQLNFKYIEDVFEDGETQESGIKNLKKFDEGYCFEVATRKPLSNSFFEMTTNITYPNTNLKEIWFFCGDTQSEAFILMQKLKEQRIKLQQQVGVYRTVKSRNIKDEALANPLLLNQRENNQYSIQTENVNRNEKDNNNGYWVLLKDWGECSVKCGGGIQTQHLLCIPPKGNGNPCFGSNIRTRPCNTMICQSYPEKSIADLYQAKDNSISTISHNTNINIIQISDIPIHYDKCYLKEANAILVTNISELRKQIQPLVVRLVMNNKTINAFELQEGKIKNSILSFDLQQTEFISNIVQTITDQSEFIKAFPNIIKDKNNCFKLVNEAREVVLCKLSKLDDAEFSQSWESEFDLFKNKCFKKKDNEKEISTGATNVISNLSEFQNNSEFNLENEFKNKVNEVKKEVAQKKNYLLEEHEIEENKMTLHKKVEDAEQQSLMKLEKEARLESLLEIEENVKEEEENNILSSKINQEKKKEECLVKAFEEKALEEKAKLDEYRAEVRIKEINHETLEELMKKREKIKERILNMRKKNQRRQKTMNEEIVHIRTQMANKIQKLAKKGNTNKCFLDNLLEKSKILKANYCGTIKNAKLRVDCLQPGGFCYACCENEIGDAYIKEREDCYDKCDKKLDS